MEITTEDTTKKGFSVKNPFNNLFCKKLFYRVNYLFKGFRMVHGQIGKNFPVELNTLGLHHIHKL